MIKKFEGFTGGGSGKNLFGNPELTASLTPGHVLGRPLSFNNWLYYLVLDDRARRLRRRVAPAARPRRARAPRRARQRDGGVSSGVSLARYKTLAFGVSAAYAGVAGSLFAIATDYVNPDTFPVELSIFLLVGVVVGGLGSLVGLIAGAIFIEFLPLGAGRLEVARGALRRLRRRPDRPDVPAADGRRGARRAFRTPNTSGLPSLRLQRSPQAPGAQGSCTR